MKLLLDTHIILWAISDDAKLPDIARTLITDKTNEVFFSLASVWEVEIKHELGKIPVSGKTVYKWCTESGYIPLRVELEHISLLSSLVRLENTPKHNDPFDRILICQAKSEGLRFMTHDSLIPDYNEECVLSV